MAAPSLSDILEQSWSLLIRGASDRRHAFHLPTLATPHREQGVDARTVVLRSVDPERRTVVAHSDARSPKVAQIEDSGHACWVFYDANSSVQVRLSGPTSVLRPDLDASAAEAWRRTGLWTRRCYLGPAPRSSQADAPSANLPDGLRRRQPTADESERGRSNFCLVETVADRIEWLRLAHDGHLRARFDWDSDATLRCDWLHP